jgi:predicted aspartyl protease
VRHLAHTRFASAGRTDDPQLPTATSLIDYIAQRLALTYLSDQDRGEILTADLQTRAAEAGLPALAKASALAEAVAPHVAGQLGA